MKRGETERSDDPSLPGRSFIMRHTGEVHWETVVGSGFFRWLYRGRAGRFARDILMQSTILHRLVGWLASSSISRVLIPLFAKETAVDISQAERAVADYRSLNDFFTRRLKKGIRPIDANERTLICPGDGKLLVYDAINQDLIIPVKGAAVELVELLGDSSSVPRYIGGTACVLRLYLADYHRIHFPSDGVPGVPIKLAGGYYAVSPIPADEVNYFCRNTRTVTQFDTDTFGTITFVDIGGFLISSIKHLFTPGKRVEKGAEKSLFRFGGSTLVMICEKGAARFHEDILINSRKGLETYVRLGEAIGDAG